MTEETAPPDPALSHVAALLCRQIEECHQMVLSVFDLARERIADEGGQLEAMKTATRLMQAGAAAASALKRLHGTESHHKITLQHETSPEGGYPTPEIRKRIREKLYEPD
jgi:hypothetical protein